MKTLDWKVNVFEKDDKVSRLSVLVLRRTLMLFGHFSDRDHLLGLSESPSTAVEMNAVGGGLGIQLLHHTMHDMQRLDSHGR